MSSCPGATQIERLASGEAPAPEVAEHLDRCPLCRERLAEARDDAVFLGRVRNLASSGLGPDGAPRLNGYRIEGLLSAGAQGRVYRGVQESTQRAVAVKVMEAGEAATARQRVRAEREAEIAARLRHPNIVTVYESRRLPDGRIAVVMEFVDGVPLDAWKPPPTDESERELLRVFVAACGGVHHAHLNGVIHRDLKPDNILVTAPGRPVVLDFGIATAGGIRTTQTGEFAGTPAYASPEQATGHPDLVDALTDVYALGVMLYRMVCGSMPYELSGTLLEIARTIVEVEPVPPRRARPGLSPDLEAIVLKALRKDKNARYLSAAALALDLERYLAGEPVDARAGSGWYLVHKAISLNRGKLAWAAAGVSILIGAGVVAGVSISRASREREEARKETVRAAAVTELLREFLPRLDGETNIGGRASGSSFYRLYFRLESGAFADNPELDQALRRLWGSVYSGLGGGKLSGLVQYAEVSLRSGLMRLRAQHGKDHPEVAATLHELASVVQLRQREPEAEALCREAMEMRMRLLGASSTPTAHSRALLARILLARGVVDEAVREADLAIRTFSRLPKDEGEVFEAGMIALKARVKLDGGEPAAAEPLVREALERRMRRLQPADPDLLASLSDVADLGERAPGGALVREFASAWEIPQESVAARIREDIKTLAGAEPSAYDGLRRTGRTAVLARQARIYARLVGPEHPSLAQVYIAQMRSAVTEDLSETRTSAALAAAAILSRRFGANDTSVLVCMEEAAVGCAASGDLKGAAEHARRACEIREDIPEIAQDKIMIASGRRYYAWYLLMSGDVDGAILAYRDAIERIRDAVGEEHHLMALAEAGLAYALGSAGQLEEAERLAERAMARPSAQKVAHTDQIAQIVFAYVSVRVRCGKYENARETLQGTWENWRQAGRGNPWRREVILLMARLCRREGDEASALLWESRVDKTTQELEPPAERAGLP